MSLTKRELKDVKSLLGRKGRREQGLFLAEGVRVLEEAMRYGFRPEVVCYVPAELGHRGDTLLGRFRKAGVRTLEITARDLTAMADTETPQGILAVFGTPAAGLEELYRPDHRKLLLCENIGDPGNLGTLVRSAAAFGFALVIAVGATAEPYSPKVVRSSAGAIFGVAVAKAHLKSLEAFLKARRIRLAAADVHGLPGDFRRLKRSMPPRLMLAVGSEAAGLSDELLALADYRLRVQHTDRVDSLNAAVAGSILMKQIYDLHRE